MAQHSSQAASICKLQGPQAFEPIISPNLSFKNYKALTQMPLDSPAPTYGGRRQSLNGVSTTLHTRMPGYSPLGGPVKEPSVISIKEHFERNSPSSVLNTSAKELVFNDSQIHRKLKSTTVRHYDLSIGQTVGFLVNKPKFGFEHYNPPNGNRNLIKPESHRLPKERRDTFPTVPKMKQLVPSPSQYGRLAKWEAETHLQHAKFVKGKKNTYVDQIFANSKRPEKCSPSPTEYKNLEALKKMVLPQIHGGEIQTDPRTTEFDEAQLLALETPCCDYDIPPLVSFDFSGDSVVRINS